MKQRKKEQCRGMHVWLELAETDIAQVEEQDWRGWMDGVYGSTFSFLFFNMPRSVGEQNISTLSQLSGGRLRQIEGGKIAVGLCRLLAPNRYDTM